MTDLQVKAAEAAERERSNRAAEALKLQSNRISELDARTRARTQNLAERQWRLQKWLNIGNFGIQGIKSGTEAGKNWSETLKNAVGTAGQLMKLIGE